MNERYVWRGGEELLLRHGAGSAVTLLVLPALFEEANRMRRLTVSVMRGLAEQGIGSVLPDLPGTGESLIGLAEITFDDWRDAAAAVAKHVRNREGRCLTVAIRGGAMLDEVGDHGWRLSPDDGIRLVRDLVRATSLTSGMKPSELDAQALIAPVSLAGNALSPALYKSMKDCAIPAGDRRIMPLPEDGPRLWRAAEPGEDPALAAAAVDDIARWVATCAV